MLASNAFAAVNIITIILATTSVKGVSKDGDNDDGIEDLGGRVVLTLN